MLLENNVRLGTGILYVGKTFLTRIILTDKYVLFFGILRIVVCIACGTLGNYTLLYTLEPHQRNSVTQVKSTMNYLKQKTKRVSTNDNDFYFKYY